MEPLSRLLPPQRRAVRALLTDVDGTLTTGGRLRAPTLRAMERWKEAGRLLAVVTGRAAGWAESMARLWPVDAVIAENGGVRFLWRDGRLERTCSVPEKGLAAGLRRLNAAAREIRRRVPGARLSMDSRYGETALAIDHHEAARLPPQTAEAIESALRARGLEAVRSSVHVNFWYGRFDKLTGCRALLKAWRLAPEQAVYVGDSFNDEPLFRGLPLTVGVANVRQVLDRLKAPPRFVTRAAEGEGFQELVRALLR